MDAARRFFLVGLAGASLTLVQYGAMREFAALLGSSELVSLVVTCAYFCGLSVGYLVSDRIQPRALLGVGLGAFVLQASLPFSLRLAVGTLWRWDAAGAVPPLVLAFTVFGLAPFLALFLPRLIDEDTRDAGRGGASSLGAVYAAEIAGALLGLGLVLVIGTARMGLLIAAQLVILVVLLRLAAVRAGLPGRALYALLVVPLAYAWAHPVLDARSLAYLYRWSRGLLDAEVLASELSPYQRVDIVRGHRRDEDTQTFLYLNGNLLYGTRALHVHNLGVSILPNLVRHSARALVVAGGSLDAARHLAPRVGALDVVELDETVTRLALAHVQAPRGPMPGGWSLAIDDGKHFLATHAGPWDVISVDVPVPTYVQTAMLHSARFFAMAHARLKPGGILAISLSGRLRAPAHGVLEHHLANRIVAGLRESFRYVHVVTIDGADFAWASDAPLATDGAGLRAVLDAATSTSPELRDAFGAPSIGVVEPARVARWSDGVEPIGEADMRVALQLSVRKFLRRFYASEE